MLPSSTCWTCMSTPGDLVAREQTKSALHAYAIQSLAYNVLLLLADVIYWQLRRLIL